MKHAVNEDGCMFILQEYGSEHDLPCGGNYDMNVYPDLYTRDNDCYHTGVAIHPKPIGAFGLYLVEEWLHIPQMPCPIIHVDLWDVLEFLWPDAVVTPCYSAPKSPLRIGHKYVSVNLPQHCHTQVLYHNSEYDVCRFCNNAGRWYTQLGKDMYCGLEQNQLDLPVLAVYQSKLLVTAPVRNKIAKIGIGTIGWRSCPIFDGLKEPQAKSLASYLRRQQRKKK
jgi:hypothetical protein